jgi:hypothetical protein
MLCPAVRFEAHRHSMQDLGQLCACMHACPHDDVWNRHLIETSGWSPRPAGGLENLFHHSGNTPPRRSGSLSAEDSEAAATAAAHGQPEANTVEAEYLDHVCSVLQHL